VDDAAVLAAMARAVDGAVRDLVHDDCRWVQMALKPLNCPAAGWVTTTLAEVKTFPPPTGIWLVVPSAAPPLAEPGVLPAGAALAVPDGLLLLAPQAVRVAARPARPMPASAPRRLVYMIG
jgi:hypothetical protein